MQKEIDAIYKKIMIDYNLVSKSELTKLVELINQRFAYKDPILMTLSKENLFHNFDHLTRTTYEMTKGEFSRSKHYILMNLCKARYGLDSESRKEIFEKTNMLIEDEFEYKKNYIGFRFFVHEGRPILLMKHNYGFGSITHWVEDFVKIIDEKYIQDVGFRFVEDKITVYYRDVVINETPTSYNRVQFKAYLKEPVWTSIEAEWFETMWNQHSQLQDLIKEPNFFEGNLGYTANKMIKEILLFARRKVTIIDPYIDSTLFTLLEIIKKEVFVKVVTSNLQGDAENVFRLFKKERGNIELRSYKKLHDRFIIIDEQVIYLLGSSINSFGEKATTLVPINQPKIKENILMFLESIWMSDGPQ